MSDTLLKDKDRSSAITNTGESMVGWIMWVDQRDKNGIIMDKEKDPRNSNEFYFDISTVKPRGGFSKLESNMKVTFKPSRVAGGTLVAKDVEIA